VKNSGTFRSYRCSNTGQGSETEFRSLHASHLIVLFFALGLASAFFVDDPLTPPAYEQSGSIDGAGVGTEGRSITGIVDEGDGIGAANLAILDLALLSPTITRHIELPIRAFQHFAAIDRAGIGIDGSWTFAFLSLFRDGKVTNRCVALGLAAIGAAAKSHLVFAGVTRDL